MREKPGSEKPCCTTRAIVVGCVIGFLLVVNLLLLTYVAFLVFGGTLPSSSGTISLVGVVDVQANTGNVGINQPSPATALEVVTPTASLSDSIIRVASRALAGAVPAQAVQFGTYVGDNFTPGASIRASTRSTGSR